MSAKIYCCCSEANLVVCKSCAKAKAIDVDYVKQVLWPRIILKRK